MVIESKVCLGLCGKDKIFFRDIGKIIKYF